MIYAISMTCERDAELSSIMVDTLVANCAYELNLLQNIQINNTDGTDYHNGAGWKASMIKLDHIRKYISEYKIKDNDYILSVDSDVVFCLPDVFFELDSNAGIIGIQHQQPWRTKFGPWGHMSGCLIFLRGDIVKKMCGLSKDNLDNIRFNEFKPYDITENEDVVLSYLAKCCGANEHALPGDLSGGNFEHDVINGPLKSFYHLNYCPTEFLGEKVEGKWDIAKVLKLKGIEL